MSTRKTISFRICYQPSVDSVSSAFASVDGVVSFSKHSGSTFGVNDGNHQMDDVLFNGWFGALHPQPTDPFVAPPFGAPCSCSISEVVNHSKNRYALSFGQPKREVFAPFARLGKDRIERVNTTISFIKGMDIKNI